MLFKKLLKIIIIYIDIKLIITLILIKFILLLY